jgi:carboxypeptidase Q
MKTLASRKAFLMPIWAALAMIAFILPAAPSASAQAPPSDKRIDDIEKQFQALKQSVEDLRRNLLPAESQKPKADRPAAEAIPGTGATSTSTQEQTKEAIVQIREEGLNHSQVMQTLSYLTDVIGPRLTGSPELKRANEWSSDKLASWGLANAHLEAWGPFGRGWTLKRFSAQIVEPQDIPLIGYPKAWSPGFDQPITADVVYFDAKTEADLDKFKGKLKGAIVLVGPVREVKAHFEPLAVRRTDSDLLQLANAGEPRGFMGRRNATPPPTPGPRANPAQDGQSPARDILSYFSGLLSKPVQNRDTGLLPGRTLSFLTKEGAALLVNASSMGDGGTIFVASASVPTADGPVNRVASFGSFRSPWSADAPAMPAQITLAVEQYNRLVRMIEQGEKLKMAVDLQVQFHNTDLMSYNTIAEIPGSDLHDEIVMLGGHIDSWQAGTGATDDGTGVAAAMEAVRIIKTLKLQPRRTIRIGLWSGEEQGLLGSKAYVARHFGEFAEVKTAEDAKPAKDREKDGPAVKSTPGNTPSQRKLVRQGEYEKFSVYFNFDEGAGKIRGIFLQGNEAVRPIFRRWLEPFKDLGADTLSLDNAGGTDHLSFNSVGLPGFHFIQDPIEYWSRTHHSSADVYDRVQADDIKQAATIIAALVYDAAMTDEKMPRKPVPAP